MHNGTEIECGGFTFTSNFDSGNLARVELVAKKQTVPSSSDKNPTSNAEEVPDFEFNIWTKPDCAGTEFQNNNSTWFYFGVKGGAPFSVVKLTLMNLNKQTKMYSQGMAPVYRVVPGRPHWDRIREKPTYIVSNIDWSIEDNVFKLSFKYRTLENVRATTYFAFTYPFSYVDSQNLLKNVESRFKRADDGAHANPDEIYFLRECVCYSLEGRRVDLLTISSHHNITHDRETRLRNLFPDIQTLRPFRFHGKKVVFVSARVHPGETPSSFVLNGLLHFLLNREDPIASLLRKAYVFKLVPMLNPDGVSRGHYRTDTRGVNLNRLYLSPSFLLHPSVYAARALIRYYHLGWEEDEEEEEIADSKPLASCLQEGPESSCSSKESLVLPSKVSNIENKVSFLSLAENSPERLLGTQPDGSTNLLPSLQNKMRTTSPSEGPHCTDSIFTTIRDTLLLKVMNVDRSSETCTLPLCVFSEKVPSTFLMLEPPDCDSDLAVSPAPVLDVVHGEDSSGVTEPASNLVPEENVNPSCVHKVTRSHSARASTAPGTSPASGLFLYVDLHGHASKKGIFMYGNHFNSMEESVECMLLPRIMAFNSQNFHFTACNFTERNMYLRTCQAHIGISVSSSNHTCAPCRDRRDGMSREGSGRVAVLKLTGLVRSYTLECNYNTGRLVNTLPACARENSRIAAPPLPHVVPPKYNPHIFEEVGRALGISILDLTGSNPWSRIPNSEFHSLNGIREWLRTNCAPQQALIQKMMRTERIARRQQLNAQVGPSLSDTVVEESAGGMSYIRECMVVTGPAPLKGPAAKDDVSPCGLAPLPEPKTCHDNDKPFKVLLEPKENIGPGVLQRCVAGVVPKKLKAGPKTDVLKQVLAVRTKCAAVGALAGPSKMKTTARLQKVPALLSRKTSTKFRRGSSAKPPRHESVCLETLPIKSGLDCESVEVQKKVGKNRRTSVKSSLVKGKMDLKGLTEDMLVKQGPKRLKMALFKSDHQSLTDIRFTKSEELVIEKMMLKDMGLTKVGKEKKLSPEPSGVGTSGLSMDWGAESHLSLGFKASITKNKKKMSPKNSSHLDNVGKSSKGPSVSGKMLHDTRIEKQAINKLAPIKTIQKSPSFGKKRHLDVGKKRGKTLLRNFVTSVGKFKMSAGDGSQNLRSEKKQKKLKPKLSK
uniref:Peptidase M14 domain-containing protein n=1 Tax=Timema monikensis TaxID=170555 RepID=A0A7R9E9Q4_9NEOP|nr:unnamed protein product [Timema monikensis]